MLLVGALRSNSINESRLDSEFANPATYPWLKVSHLGKYSATLSSSIPAIFAMLGGYAPKRTPRELVLWIGISEIIVGRLSPTRPEKAMLLRVVYVLSNS